MDWQSASLHWLVADDVINAHATLTPAGDLLYTRREIQPDGMGSGGSGGAGGVLVWLTAAGDEFRLPFPGSSAAYPIASADPTLAAVLLTHPGGIDIVGVQLQTDGATGHASGLRTGQRRRLGPPAAGAGASWPDIPDGYASPEGPNLALAFQHAAPVQQPPLPEGGSKGEGGSDGSRGEGSRHVQGPRDLLSRSRGIPFFFHAQGRMAMFDPLTATVTPLPPGTVAAVPLTVGPEGGNREALTTTTTPSTERGVLVAGPRGVLAVPASSGRVETFQPEHGIQVVPGAYLPRQTGVTGRYILFGPAEGAQESGSGRAGRGTAAAAGVSRGASWAGNQPGFEVLVVEVFAPSAE